MDSFHWFNAQITNRIWGTHLKGRHSASIYKLSKIKWTLVVILRLYSHQCAPFSQICLHIINNCLSKQSSIMYTSERTCPLGTSSHWLAECRLFVYQLFVHQLFVHQLFVHQLFVHQLFVHQLFVHQLFVHRLFVR